jgi:hypothetical protein
MSALRFEQALIYPTHQQEELNEEESLSARNGNRDERWICACSKQRIPDDNNSEDLPRPTAISVGCPEHVAESNVSTAAEFGPGTGSVLFVLFVDVGCTEFQQQQRSVQYIAEQQPIQSVSERQLLDQ